MKRLLIFLLGFLTLPNAVNSYQLYIQKELIVISESTRESIKLAKYLNDNSVVKYAAYWSPNCLNKVNYLVSKLIENLMYLNVQEMT